MLQTSKRPCTERPPPLVWNKWSLQRHGTASECPRVAEGQVKGSLSEGGPLCRPGRWPAPGAAGRHSPAPSDPSSWQMPSSESPPSIPHPQNAASSPVCPRPSNLGRRKGQGQEKAFDLPLKAGAATGGSVSPDLPSWDRGAGWPVGARRRSLLSVETVLSQEGDGLTAEVPVLLGGWERKGGLVYIRLCCCGRGWRSAV